MTRLVPRPDWTPVEFVLAVRAAVWEQGVTPETAANRPTVLALFRPAEDAAGAGEKGESSGELPAIGRVVDGQAMTATSADSTIPPAPAPVAPPPAEERADLPASEESSWVPVLVESRTPETESVMIHHAHRGQACVACELAALRAENERLRNLPVAPPPAEERKEWPPKRPKPVALIPTPTCSEERDPWGNAESRVRTLAHEANNEAGADVAIHLFRAAHDAALAALRSELSASQREVERLRKEVRMWRTQHGTTEMFPSGETRSEG